MFIDGARLGYGLSAKSTDVKKEDVAKLCDMFYIGGTKLGALFGEALVIVNDKYKKDFRYMIKRHGGMLAKGRLLGIQFEALFSDNLYEKGADNAIEKAYVIRDFLKNKGFEFLFESDTNQQFPVFEKSELDKLSSKYVFCPWTKVSDTQYAVRICTSWATKQEDVEKLLNDLDKIR